MATHLPPIAQQGGLQSGLAQQGTGSAGVSPRRGRGGRNSIANTLSGSRSLSRPKAGQLRTVDVSADHSAIIEPSAARSTPRQRTCLELLVAGQVEAFSEVFHLTADHEAAIAADKDALRTLKRNLAVAENGLRAGDHEAAYAARRRLAEHFTSTGELDIAADQRRKGLAVARASAVPALEADAQLSLGLLAEQQEQVAVAREAFEAFHRIANAEGLGGPLAPASAATHLGRACFGMADEVSVSLAQCGTCFQPATGSPSRANATRGRRPCCSLRVRATLQAPTPSLRRHSGSPKARARPTSSGSCTTGWESCPRRAATPMPASSIWKSS